MSWCVEIWVTWNLHYLQLVFPSRAFRGVSDPLLFESSSETWYQNVGSTECRHCISFAPHVSYEHWGLNKNRRIHMLQSSTFWDRWATHAWQSQKNHFQDAFCSDHRVAPCQIPLHVVRRNFIASHDMQMVVGQVEGSWPFSISQNSYLLQIKYFPKSDISSSFPSASSGKQWNDQTPSSTHWYWLCSTISEMWIHHILSGVSTHVLYKFRESVCTSLARIVSAILASSTVYSVFVHRGSLTHLGYNSYIRQLNRIDML